MGQSWSSIRKFLEQEYMCESLKGRIQYFVTRYPKLSDAHTRVAVRFDGREILNSDFIKWRKASVEADNDDILIHISGGFDSYEFYKAFFIYQNKSIDESISCKDPLVRLFTIFDRRVGKRRLQKMFSEISLQPEWLQPLYHIRLTAEGIIPCKK